MAYRLPVKCPEFACFIVSYKDKAVVKVVLTEYIVVANSAYACVKLNTLCAVDLVVKAANTCLMHICIAGVVKEEVVKWSWCVWSCDDKFIACFVEMSVLVVHGVKIPFVIFKAVSCQRLAVSKIR
jgi:hypothetical protein